ncbi:ferritin family protein [bacterium]|nr:ferritin family protein [bacterium]
MTIKDLLKKGIQSENEAKRFYNNLSSKVINEKVKKRLIRFYQDEDRHEKSLRKIYFKLFKEDYESIDNFKENPEFTESTKELGKDIKSVDIVKIAIQSEINAIKFYTKMLNEIVDGRDKRVLNSIIKMEKGHQDILKREYDVLKKSDYWANPTMENFGDLRI